MRLPWRERLLAEGVELANHWTHSAPCSPSRATMMTGRYLPGHLVYDNTVFPWHHSLDPAIPTVGSQLGSQGYRSSYIGKWHLTGGPTPPMDLYGYADWDGNDQHFMGWAGTGVHFDPVIADSAERWLDANGGQADPWFLTVALVNPHDVMWFPMDQPAYQAAHPDELAATEALLEASKWKDGQAVPPFTLDYDDVVEDLPASFDDDLLTKPACHRQWRWDQQHWLAGYIPPDDREQWRRQLDYYVKLHELADESLGKVLAALERSGAWDDTVIVFTSDHGDMCGSHGLRSKGPFVYDEIMRVPCYIKPAGGAGSVAVADPSRCRRTSTWPARSAASRTPIPIRGCRASTSARSSPTRPSPCATTCCSRTPPRTRRTSAPPAGPSAACSTVVTSTRATTASAAACPTTTSPGCPPRCSTAPTPPSRTRSTSGTTSRRIPTSWSTSRWTTAVAPSFAERYADLMDLEAKELAG